MGLIYATLGEHEAAVQQFIAATGLDNYLAVASVPLPPSSSAPFFFISINSSYFQCGVSNFLLGRYERSSKDFEEALLYLRGNQSMYATHFHPEFVHSHSSSNYTQLGLAFTLFSAEVLFNKGEPSPISLFYLLNSSLRSLLNLSWSIARGHGRVRGRH